MKKLIFIILILYSSASLFAIDKLTSLSQLEENKFTFLVFEKKGCPWCARYKIELEDIALKYKSEIK